MPLFGNISNEELNLNVRNQRNSSGIQKEGYIDYSNMKKIVPMTRSGYMDFSEPRKVSPEEIARQQALFDERTSKGKIKLKVRAKDKAQQIYDKALDTARAVNDPGNRKRVAREFNQAKFKVGREVGSAVGVAQRQQVDFSLEQRQLQQMFGHGDKIWGLGPESGTQVEIHNDLNPRQRGDTGTGEMFGF